MTNRISTHQYLILKDVLKHMMLRIQFPKKETAGLPIIPIIWINILLAQLVPQDQSFATTCCRALHTWQTLAILQ